MINPEQKKKFISKDFYCKASIIATVFLGNSVYLHLSVRKP
jgi:hypothetical protein